MPILTGEKGKLLEKVYTLKKQIDLLQKEYKKVRKDLDLTKVGEYTNTSKTDFTLIIGETVKYSDIDTRLMFRYMKDQKQLKNYWGCVKAQLTQMKKYVPESSFKNWRKKLDPIIKWNFK